MGTAQGRFHIHWRQRTRAPKDISQCIPLKQYAAQENYSPQNIRYRIATRKIIAYKIKGRWYVDPRSTEIPSET